jgi:hypothetical protein
MRAAPARSRSSCALPRPRAAAPRPPSVRRPASASRTGPTCAPGSRASRATPTRRHPRPARRRRAPRSPRRPSAARATRAPRSSACAFCHSEPRNPGATRRVDRALVFSHGPHVARERGGCVSCHAVAGADATTVRSLRPAASPPWTPARRAATATTCAALRCAAATSPSARYGASTSSRPRPPRAGLRAPPRRRGPRRHLATQLCAQCHDARPLRPLPHALRRALPSPTSSPWRSRATSSTAATSKSRHAEEARLNARHSCTRCHGVTLLRRACHRAERHRRLGRPRAHAPARLARPARRRGATPARPARNLLACASCHESDAARTCTPCHRVGGGAGNPHPPGFSRGPRPGRSTPSASSCHGRSP